MSKNSLNKVMLIGNLGDNPDTRYLQTGGCVSSFSIATTETFKKNDEKKERTEWHHVVFFGRLAEIISEYVTKGQKVYIEGSLKTEKWERQDGSRGQITKIIGNKFLILERRSREPGDEDGHKNLPDIPDVDGSDVPF
jgi:single-strand DNA-binding protein